MIDWPALDADLRRMWVVEKRSITQIHRALGVSRSAVAGRLYRLDLMGQQKPRAPRPYRDYRDPFAQNSGDWEVKVREPYIAFKARRQAEREAARASQ